TLGITGKSGEGISVGSVARRGNVSWSWAEVRSTGNTASASAPSATTVGSVRFLKRATA
ncbi:MAG: hypothetical protein JO263_07260, partial [Candidatus Eremiobacteraeota bacterium]|nr:hypothetical protein [Candidatus Eremiobacteraeota bacterium]